MYDIRYTVRYQYEAASLYDNLPRLPVLYLLHYNLQGSEGKETVSRFVWKKTISDVFPWFWYIYNELISFFCNME